MKFAAAVERDDPVTLVARALQLLLVGLVGYGALVGRIDLLVNGVVALAFALLPLVAAWRYDETMDVRLVLWITVAAVVHVLGFLGPYHIQSGPWAWYDQTAHAISASFVAGVAYALIMAIDRNSSRVRFPEEFRFVFTLWFILAFGVAWEIVEFGTGALAEAVVGGEVLVQYGVDDVVFDLLFNTLAASLVALWGTGYFENVAGVFSRHLPDLGKL